MARAKISVVAGGKPAADKSVDELFLDVLHDAPHVDIAQDHHDFLEKITTQPPAYRGGEMMLYDVATKLYSPLSERALALAIASRYRSTKTVKKWPDARQVANLQCAMAEKMNPLPDPPAGVATLDRFIRVTAQGLREEALTAAHCCTYALKVNPDFDRPSPLLNAFLERNFVGDDADDRRQLAQEIAGGALTGLIPKMQKAVLFFGVPRTGKSTLSHIIAALLPPSRVTSTSPTRWGHEYYVAALVHKLLNIVGELSAKEPIPAPAFKMVVGGDRLQGREPNHRPFEFINTATHVFVSNYFPPCEDRSEGFFRRWVILHFDNPMTEGQTQDLHEQTLIEAELPQILAWALKGAERLHRQRRFTETASHDRLIKKWRLGNSSVLEFLSDEQSCRLQAGVSCRQPNLYAAYTQWCEVAGRRRIGRNTFFEEIDSTGGVLGVFRKKERAADMVHGVSIVGSGLPFE